jgi:glycerol kinase
MRAVNALWAGMSTATTRRDLQQSLLEGIALQTQLVLAALDRVTDVGSVLSVDGGLTSSEYFLQFLADVTGKAIRKNASPEITAYGCALVAGYNPASGAPGVDRHYEPRINADTSARYKECYSSSADTAVELSL